MSKAPKRRARKPPAPRNKEKLVVDALLEIYPKLVHNRVVKGTSFRPDALLLFRDRNVIIEIDEKQHRSEARDKRRTRMDLIHMAFGGKRPTLFIRFNPDGYKGADGKIRRGCFSRGGVKVIFHKKWDERLKELKRCIEVFREAPLWEGLKVVNLYYDGCKF